MFQLLKQSLHPPFHNPFKQLLWITFEALLMVLSSSDILLILQLEKNLTSELQI